MVERYRCEYCGDEMDQRFAFSHEVICQLSAAYERAVVRRLLASVADYGTLNIGWPPTLRERTRMAWATLRIRVGWLLHRAG